MERKQNVKEMFENNNIHEGRALEKHKSGKRKQIKKPSTIWGENSGRRTKNKNEIR